MHGFSKKEMLLFQSVYIITYGMRKATHCNLALRIEHFTCMYFQNLYVIILEFEEGRNWIANSLSFEQNRFVSFFETTIRVLGGLLSAYHLSGDRMFMERAQDLGNRLAAAYESSSPIPYSDVNLLNRFAFIVWLL